MRDSMSENPSDELAAAYHIEPEEEKRVIRKLDRVILPLMALIFFFQSLDKQSFNYAAVFGLSEDLGLTGGQFSWLISLFYIGQFFSEYPAAYLMSRFSITLVVGTTVMLWGISEMGLGATTGWSSIAAVRFLLGFTDGAVAPSFMIITSGWYKRSEHPIRIATWLSMFGVSQIAGGLMMFGIGQADMKIASWRVLFIVCGALTVVSGIIFMVFMPRNTNTAWFLDKREREIATQRLAADRVTRDKTSWDNAQFKEALTDPRTALYALMALFITIPTPISKFSSLVINGFGFNKFSTMLVGLPSGAVSLAFVWVGALGPALFPNMRCIIGVFVTSMPLMGTLLLVLLPANNAWGIVVSTWFASSSTPPFSIAMGLMASNVKGNTKRSVVGAIFFIFYTVGSVVGPQLWQKNDAPRYTKGCYASIVSWSCLILSFMVYYVTAKRSNRKREALVGDMFQEIDGVLLGISVDSDHTEREDKMFRYSY